jgi:DedD protein
MAEEQQDVETLKRRGRRRLVGAVALVLAAVIVLPMVFDPEPKSTLPPVSVKIPGENETPFKPKPPAQKPPSKLEAPKPEAARPEAAKPEEPAAVPASAAQEYVFTVGTFAKPETVVGKLAGANIPHYTEPAPGKLVRVRAGPFASREAAEQALARLKGMGVKTGPVSAR